MKNQKAQKHLLSNFIVIWKVVRISCAERNFKIRETPIGEGTDLK